MFVSSRFFFSLAAMEIISEKPAGGNKRSSSSYTYSYTHNSKRVGAPKRYEEDVDRCGRGKIQKKIQCHGDKACTYWLAGNCKYAGDDCKYLHSHVIGGSDATFLTKLVGHDNKVGLRRFLFFFAYSFPHLSFCIFLVFFLFALFLGFIGLGLVVSWFP